ncbi:MAG: hypothetical protein KVP17_003619 [Porospora cf. gigantea B]|uniref:uncharacterized protein n=1 Tax=Porospora cf. gigantea B TaxID=2853592 RepID=UPI0035719C3F|nr:MAG: hypothetical protein KVP17_003619 [Porospora cf. gigantea B]
MNSVPVNVLGHRYVVQEEKGCGSYGTVFAMKRSVCTKAHCTCPPPLLALKVFDSSEGSGEGLCQTTLRETHAMLALKHENVMPITHMCWDLKWPGVGRRFGMAMPLMEGNLKDLMNARARTEFRTQSTPLSQAYVEFTKKVSAQIINGMAACHANDIAHRDLKPQNILWSGTVTDPVIRIGDFGLARFMREDTLRDPDSKTHSGTIQTLWYRAPEVIFGASQHTLAVDLWSLGLIIAEMYNFSARGYPDPLIPESSEISYLFKCLDYFGYPTDEADLEKFTAKDKYGKRMLPYFNTLLPKLKGGKLKTKMPHADGNLLDLLDKMFQWNPEKRGEIQRYLLHPWFDSIREYVDNLQDFIALGPREELMRSVKLVMSQSVQRQEGLAMKQQEARLKQTHIHDFAVSRPEDETQEKEEPNPEKENASPTAKCNEEAEPRLKKLRAQQKRKRSREDEGPDQQKRKRSREEEGADKQVKRPRV